MSLSKNIIIFLAFIFIGFSGLSKTDEPRDRKFLLMSRDTFDIPAVIPVTKTTVLRFEKDSIAVYDSGREKRKLELASFPTGVFQNECNTDLTVKVVADNGGKIPEEGLYVALLNTVDDPDFFRLEQPCDEEGNAVFGNIPYGEYSLYVRDAAGVFDDAAASNLLHEYNDTFELPIHEEVVLPSDFKHNYEYNDDGLCTVELLWFMGPILHYGPFRDYLFRVNLNGEYKGETSETNFYLEDLEPGDYTVSLTALSWYGNEWLLPYEYSFTVAEPPVSTGLNDVCADEKKIEYYDLNGLKLKERPSKKGIYIFKKRDKSVKITL